MPGDHLISRTDELAAAPDDDQIQLRLERLAAEFVAASRRGERPSIAEYAQRHPDLAGGIEELFPTIAQLERMKQQDQSSSSGRAVFGLPQMIQLGDFRIVREVGRGGMGIVFEAEQVTLHRRVALKVLGANVAATDSQLVRFRREAESAARLHHTNIVPVYGTGDDHGVHFYAMQYIDGWSLVEIVDALSGKSPEDCNRPDRAGPSTDDLSDCTLPLVDDSPIRSRMRLAPAAPQTEQREGATSTALEPVVRGLLNPRKAARIAADLADAVEYAHSQGVLHRDIKPSNVLVDRTGTAWLVDFGLAKHFDDASLTKTGNVVGTVPYMAPEQFSGEFDVRSDVHSLGLTLYELLSLTPAFANSNQAALMRRKVSGQPASMRLIAPQIPRDLETVVMKACAVDPRHRYATAADFGADLRRFVNDEPILAKRTTPISRMWRWARVHRTIAALSGLTLALLLSLIVVLGLGRYRAQLAVDAISRQKGRTQATLDVAVDALDEIMANVSQRGVPRTLRLDLGDGQMQISDVAVTSADAELLDSLLKFYDRFAAENEADLEVETARALSRLGDIELRLGHLDRAADAFEKSLQRYLRLRREHPRDEGLALAEASALNQLGIAQAGSGDVRAAIDSHGNARRRLEEFPIQSMSVRLALAQSRMLRGTVGWRAGMREMFAGVMSEGSPLPLPPPEFSVHAEFRGPPPGTAGDGPGPAGPPAGPGFNPMLAALEDLNQASRLLHALMAEEPFNPEYRLAVAQCDLDRREFVQIGPQFLAGQREPSSAAEPESILRSLVEEFPDSPKFRYELAEALTSRAQFQNELAPAERQAHLLEAVEMADLLTTAYPRMSAYRALAARGQHDLALQLKSQGESDEAWRRFQAACAIQRALAEENVTSAFYQVAWAQMLMESAAWQQGRGQPADAADSLQEALLVAEHSAPSWGPDPFFRQFLEQLRRRAGSARH